MGKNTKNKNFKSHNRKPYSQENRNRSNNSNPAKAHARQEQRQDWGRLSLREDQVGITEFISGTPGFTGVVKSRFSDFHVNEIDSNGKILELTDLTIPQLIDDKLTAEELAYAREELNSIITAEIWEKIEALAGSSGKDENEPIEIDVNEMSKEKRTQIHQVLKKMFAGKLVSTTTNREERNADGSSEKKLIKIMKPKGSRDNRIRWTFPGECVHFLMHKENMDTSEVASSMADRLSLRPSQVNYCGTKDKRAKTTQKFCIKRRTPSQIVGSVKGLRQVHVGNFEFSNEVLKLGDLKGNRFRIALRHISGDEEEIKSTLEVIRERGFINYFGLQRFGNSASIPTYDVGVALLKSDFKLACELILKPRIGDPPFMRAVREAWWADRDSKAAAAKLRNDKFIEKKLLDGLAQLGENDYSTALRKIPRNMLLLYPHSFQSLIFNQIATRRIKELGFTLIPGDLVYRNKEELDADTDEILLEENDVVVTESPDSQDQTDTAETPTESVFKRKVKPLSAEDIASGSYTLFDVVLPLPGYDITYPNNVVADWYEQALVDYGLSSEKMRHNVKTYAMAGAYRKLIIQPTNMNWQFHTYDSAESTLIQSDWEKLKPKPNMTNADENAAEGKFKALVLDFCLPTSAYATMMLRELLKSDTSPANQTEVEKSEVKKATDKNMTHSSESPTTTLGVSVDDADVKSTTDEPTKTAESDVYANRNIEKLQCGVMKDSKTAERTAIKRKAEPDSDKIISENDSPTDGISKITTDFADPAETVIKQMPEISSQEN